MNYPFIFSSACWIAFNIGILFSPIPSIFYFLNLFAAMGMVSSKQTEIEELHYEAMSYINKLEKKKRKNTN